MTARDVVRVHITDADFYLLPETASADSAQELAEQLTSLRGTDGTLRLRPRTTPEPGQDNELTGREDPGTTWRDVLGEAIGEVETLTTDEPVAFWHWAIERAGEDATGFSVG